MIGDDPHVIRMAALKNQLMSAGLNRYVPYSTVGQMGATPYLFRSGFNGGIVFGEDVRPRNYPRELLKQAIAEGQRIRKYWLGDFYAISEADTDASKWVVLQYHRPAEQDGIVVAFRRHRSPYSSFDCQLRGIDADKPYQVSLCPTYQFGAPVRMPGSVLARLKLPIDECPGSLVVEYKLTN
jgi:alpha-galactosidase